MIPSGRTERERPSAVLGIGLGLALLFFCALALVLVRERPLDPALALADSFELAELPFGMRLERALLLPGGETLVVLGDGRELPSSALPPDPSEPERADREPPGAGPAAMAAEELPAVDWSKVVELEAGTPPARLFLLRHPAASAERALGRAFRNLEWRELSELDAKGGRLAVEGGRIPWGAFAADFVRERRFLPGLAFEDSIRVNLSLPGRYWIAYAFWPRGYPASKERVEELLDALRALPADA